MSFNANFAAELVKQSSRPCFVLIDVSAGGFIGSYGYYSAIIPSGADGAANWEPYLVSLSPTSQSLNPLDGKLTLADVTFGILATDGDVLSKVVGTEDPAGGDPDTLHQTVALVMGYRSLAWTDWEIVFRGLIKRSKLVEDGNLWQITVVSAISKATAPHRQLPRVTPSRAGDRGSGPASPSKPG